MPIHLRENQYPGVNAHLNSFLQNEAGEWESFYADYITYIRVALDAELPSGYRAQSEKSLQISELTPSDRPVQRTKPDITIFQRQHTSTPSQPTPSAATPVAEMPILETLDAEDFLVGVVIYQAGEGSRLGRPITRIEVLSPANKPSGSHYHTYLSKRFDTLRSGLRLVEIDYLHETRPILGVLPSYPDRDEGAFPYWITVSDPRPALENGLSRFYGFGVDEAVPPIEIPLAGADKIVFDLGAVYQRLFAESRLCMDAVDYEQLPARFETHTPADQERIRARMAAVVNSST